MLTESNVIDAICIKLQSENYQIRQKLLPVQKGDDIVAVKQVIGRMLYVEAKGETSSRLNSKRYGKPFESADIRVNLGEALYKVAETLSKKHENVEVRVGIALPDNKAYRACVNKIQSFLMQTEIAIFWVREGHAIEFVSSWAL
jgi:hypothetical protein